MLCALLLLALQAPPPAAQASIHLPRALATPMLQAGAAGEHQAILKSGQTAPERGVPHDADNPCLRPSLAPSAPVALVPVSMADQVTQRRPDLGFWACAPPSRRS